MNASAARPILAIVGRPNVGKSTLFNRIAGKRLAIVEDVPGVTRDRNYADVDWEGRPFTLVDTGGFLPEPDNELLGRVRDQALLAVQEAEVILLVVDGMSGLTNGDQEIAGLLRKSGKAVFLAVNKLDSARREEEGFFTDFYRLGLKEVFPVSAEHGRGIADFMERVVENFPPREEYAREHEEICRVAIVGRPNVGKSTLVNRLLGEERFVVSEVPGTTTDSHEARLEYAGRSLVLVDTAGLRRKRSIAQKVEQFSVMRSLSAIDRAQVVVLVLDATELAVEQDARIAGIALEKGKAIVVFINKWDLVAGTAREAEFRNELKIQMPFLNWAPVVLGSAKTGKHILQIVERAGEVHEHRRTRLPTPLLNDFLERIIDEHPAPLAPGGNPVRMFYIAQVAMGPPTFAITCNRPEAVTNDYKRFIVNRMRDAFGLRVPIVILLKPKSKRPFVIREKRRRKK